MLHGLSPIVNRRVPLSSSGLGYLVLSQGTGVRVPLGVPEIESPVAQSAAGLFLLELCTPRYNAGMSEAEPVVRYRDETPPTDCPYGNVQRIVTGGLGGIANVHVVRVTEGRPHRHDGYDEVYYVLSGRGTLTLESREYPLRPGAVAVIRRGSEHALQAEGAEPLEFIIFGTPALAVDDPGFRPRSTKS